MAWCSGDDPELRTFWKLGYLLYGSSRKECRCLYGVRLQLPLPRRGSPFSLHLVFSITDAHRSVSVCTWTRLQDQITKSQSQQQTLFAQRDRRAPVRTTPFYQKVLSTGDRQRSCGPQAQLRAIIVPYQNLNSSVGGRTFLGPFQLGLGVL